MAKGDSAMALARRSEGISVIFDVNSPPSTCARSRSRSSSMSSGTRRLSGFVKRRHRSSSSSSSPSSGRSSRSRSRSYPRCYRPSSRCRCDNHRRYGRGRHRRSLPRRYRAYSRSYSRSPSQDRYSQRRRYRSRSRSPGAWNRSRRTGSPLRSRPARSPPKRSRSRSRSSSGSCSLSLNDKKELLQAAKANAMKILGVEKLEIPESVKPVLPEKQSEGVSPLPETRVRQDPRKSPSESSEDEPDESSPKMSPQRKLISFSINNSVARPTVAGPPSAKVTARMDSYESRKPYGHWVPVRSGHSSARKHKSNKSQ
ncbi:arginine/serine-rich protein 1 [Aulostomus maculatus]